MTSKPSSNKKNALSSAFRKATLGTMAGVTVLTATVGAASAHTNSGAFYAQEGMILHSRQDPALQGTSKMRCVGLNDPSFDENVRRNAERAQGYFNTMNAHMPITGASVLAALRDPYYNMRICFNKQYPTSSGVHAAYIPSRQQLIVPERSIRFNAVAHEVFHARQHIRGGFYGFFASNPYRAEDRAMALLLAEASAVAYSMAAKKELQLNNPALAREYSRGDDLDYGMWDTFDRTFNSVYRANANQPEDTRRRMALQEAGQTVVRALLDGRSSVWVDSYRDAAQNALRLSNARTPQDPNSVAYQSVRSSNFYRMGEITDGVNVVPSEYWAMNNAAATARTFRAMGLDSNRRDAPQITTRIRFGGQ